MNEARSKDAARERLFAVQFADAVGAPVARAFPASRSRAVRMWIAAAFVLGVGATLGVALMQPNGDRDAAQGPGRFDAVYPWYEREYPWVQRVTEVEDRQSLSRLSQDAHSVGVPIHALRLLPEVSRRKGIRRVDLIDREGVGATDRELWTAIGKVQALESLVLRGVSCDVEGVRELRHATNLRCLAADSGMLLDRGMAASVCEVPRLHFLALGTQPEPEGLAKLAGLPHLQGLALELDELTDEIVEAIARLRTLQFLYISCRHPHTSFAAAYMRQWASLPQLRALYLHNVDLEEGALEALPRTLEALSMLQVGGQSTAGIQALADLPHLRSLAGSHLRAGPMREIQELLRRVQLERFEWLSAFPEQLRVALGGQRRLRRLRIRCISDIAAEVELCSKLPALESLTLICRRLPTPDDVAVLAGHPKLRELTVQIEARFEPSAIEALRAQLPSVTVRAR